LLDDAGEHGFILLRSGARAASGRLHIGQAGSSGAFDENAAEIPTQESMPACFLVRGAAVPFFCRLKGWKYGQQDIFCGRAFQHFMAARGL
jgi:hypothetical protein